MMLPRAFSTCGTTGDLVDSESGKAALLLMDREGRILDWDADCARLWQMSEPQARQAGAARLFAGSLSPGALAEAGEGASHRNVTLRLGDGSTAQAACVIRRHSVAGHDLFSAALQLHNGRHPLPLPHPLWNDILDGLPCLFYVVDSKAHLLRWNRHLVEAFEIPEPEMKQVDVMRFIDPADHAVVQAKIGEALSTGSSSHEAVLVGARGKRTPYLFHCAATMLNGERCLFGTAVDITERKRHELRLLVNERAMDACVNAIMITRRDGCRNLIEYVNPSFSAITGYSQAECLGRDPSFMKAGDMDAEERARIRDAVMNNQCVHALIRNVHKNGKVFWNDLRISPVINDAGQVSHSVAVIQDVTEALRTEEQLRHLATHDQLTGLANRAMLHDSLKSAIERTRRDGGMLALAYVDLDNFKLINDSLGHDAGDKVLVTIAARLRSEVRAGDTVARLGGDEFVAIFCHCKCIDQIGDLVERLHASLASAIPVSGKEVTPMASIGVSLFPHDGADARAILRSADAAMYQAKSSGKNQVKFYSADMDVSIHDYLERELNLRHGIERDELFLNFQPKVDLRSGAMVGAEVLVRWNHPTEGVVMPADFITLAEESGCIIRLGEWVLEQACAAVKKIRSAGYPLFTLSVNLSARQLRKPDFVQSVAALLERYEVPRGSLEFEVTESQLMDAPDQAAATLEQLKDLGLQLSIDDFGTGYSSLSYLQKFPVDYIKIDRSFLADLQRSGDSVIAQAIIALGHNLDMCVIAEGVETPDQLQFLREHRCDYMQGHYFSPALSRGALLDLLASGATMH